MSDTVRLTNAERQLIAAADIFERLHGSTLPPDDDATRDFLTALADVRTERMKDWQ